MDASSMKEKSKNTHKRPYEGDFINGEQILSSYCCFNISLKARVAEHNPYSIFNNVLRKHYHIQKFEVIRSIPSRATISQNLIYANAVEYGCLDHTLRYFSFLVNEI